MSLKTTSETRIFAKNLSELLVDEGTDGAIHELTPVLNQRTPFRLLDITGAQLGQLDDQIVDEMLKRIVSLEKGGGWVVAASALREKLDDSLIPVLKKCMRSLSRQMCGTPVISSGNASLAQRFRTISMGNPVFSILAQPSERLGAARVRGCSSFLDETDKVRSKIQSREATASGFFEPHAGG